jgi:hypothetical protein
MITTKWRLKEVNGRLGNFLSKVDCCLECQDFMTKKSQHLSFAEAYQSVAIICHGGRYAILHIILG